MRKQSFESIRDQLNGNYGTRSKGHFGGQRSFMNIESMSQKFISSDIIISFTKSKA